MPVDAKTEWMTVQQNASVMQPGKSFRVLQTPEGATIFLSITTEGALYMYRESEGTSTGWRSLDLSSQLAQLRGSKSLKTKMFTVSQSMKTLAYDLAVVMADGSGTDRIYACLGLSSDAASWDTAIGWKEVPFDCVRETRGSIEVDFVDIMGTSGVGSGPTCIVDILRQPGDALKLLDRFYLDFAEAPHWHRHALPIDLQKGSIQSITGLRQSDSVSGIYTMGKLEDREQLIYAARYNYYDPGIPANPVRLTLPAGATALGTSLDKRSESTLYVAGASGISAFATDNQEDGAEPELIVTDELCVRSQSIGAQTAGGRTALWGIGFSGALWYTQCAAGHETEPSAWQPVIPLLRSAQNCAFYVARDSGRLTLFAHAAGANMTCLVQDPVTSAWIKRQALLPSPDVYDLVEVSSFTTRLVVSDANGNALALETLKITSTSPVAVFVNGSYRLLRPDTPLRVQADEQGAVMIMQKAGDLNAVAYKVSQKGPDGAEEMLLIDPSRPGMERLAKITTVAQLEAMLVTDPVTGKQDRLLPADTSAEDKEALLKALKQFSALEADLPRDGRRQVAATKAQAQASVVSAAATSVVLSAGDLFMKIRNGLNTMLDYTLQAIEGTWNFVCKIGNTVYNAVLDCIAAVKAAIGWIFEKVKVGVQKVIAVLSFVFNWGDIKRTHRVLVNAFNLGTRQAISILPMLSGMLTEAMDSLKSEINNKAGLEIGDGASINAKKNSTGDKSVDSPQCRSSTEDFKNQVGNTKPVDAKGAADKGLALPKPLRDALNALVDVLKKAGKLCTDLADQINEQIIKPFGDLTATDVIKRFLGILAGFGLDVITLVLTSLLNVLAGMADKFIDGLNEKIKIPIFSALYRRISGSDLSWIDLICLVIAIPLEVAVKIATGAPSFPDDANTQAIIDAKSWPDLVFAFSGTHLKIRQKVAPLSSEPKGTGALDSRAVDLELAKPSNSVVVLNGASPSSAKKSGALLDEWLEISPDWWNSTHRVGLYTVLHLASDLAATALGVFAFLPAIAQPASAKMTLFGLFIAPNILADIEGSVTRPGGNPDNAPIYIADFIICTTLFLRIPAQEWLEEKDGRLPPFIDIVGHLLWMAPSYLRYKAIKDAGETPTNADLLLLLSSVSFGVSGIAYGVADFMAASPMPSAPKTDVNTTAKTDKKADANTAVKTDNKAETSTATKLDKKTVDKKPADKAEELKQFSKAEAKEKYDEYKELLVEEEEDDGNSDIELASTATQTVELASAAIDLGSSARAGVVAAGPGRAFKIAGAVTTGIGAVLNAGTAIWIYHDHKPSSGPGAPKYTVYRRP